MLSTHLQLASFTFSLTCYPPIFLSIQLQSVSLALGLTCIQALHALATLTIQPQLLSGQFAIRPHIHAIKTFAF